MEDALDLGGFESTWDNYVSFYIGCSFTFETALLENGIELVHTLTGKNVSTYTTNIALYPVGPFEGKMTVSMRMIAKNLLEKAFVISSQYPDHHGAPVHVGDPSRIGIDDIMKSDNGDPPVARDGDIPVFWACGVTSKEAIFSASKSTNIIWQAMEWYRCQINRSQIYFRSAKWAYSTRFAFAAV